MDFGGYMRWTVLDNLSQLSSAPPGVRQSSRVTIPVRNLASAASTTDGTSFATASISPTAGYVQYCGVTSHVAGGAPTPTVTGAGLTWVQEETQVLGATRRLTVFRAYGTASAGALTIDFGVSTQTACAWSVVECGGTDVTGTAGSGATLQSVPSTASNQTGHTSTLAAVESPSNVHLCFVAINANVDIVPTAFTQLGDSGAASTAVRLGSFWAYGSLSCAVTFTTADVSAISIEVKAA